MTPVPERSLRVFISYSHDSPEHADRVLALSDRLRRDGFDAILDQYEVSPPEGWPLWMDKHIRDADFVLMVCTPTYYLRVMGEEEEGVGLGVRWEGKLIYNRIFADGAKNERFLPILMEGGAFGDIPTPIQGGVIPRLGTADGYDALRRLLVGQAAAPRPPLGPRPRVTDFFHPWNVPHRQNPFFTGREDVIADLRATLISGTPDAPAPPQVISGLGGVGKTQTAIEYAYRYRQDYQAILWAQTDSETTLTADFAKIAALLGLPEASARDLDKTREAVTRWLGETPGWLLILDNADNDNAADPAWLARLLPPSPAGHILLTSRTRDFAALGVDAPVNLPVLPQPEAVAFLLRRTLRQSAATEEQAAAMLLAEELGRLPLALEQAAAYIVVNQALFADYLASYRKRALALLEKKGPQTGGYEKTVAVTWDINFKAVQASSEASVELLRVSAFLSPSRIPEELLLLGAPELGNALATALADVEEDRLLLDELLEPLARYSLIQRDIDARTYDIHRLVQAVIQHGMDEVTRRVYAARVVLAVVDAFPNAKVSTWPLCERLLPHARECVAHVADYALEGAKVARLLNTVGYYLKQRAQYKEAESLYQQSLTMCQRILGPEDPATLTCLNNIAVLYRTHGKTEEALSLSEQVLALRKKVLRADHRDIAESLNNLALVYKDQGRYMEAASLYREALIIWDTVLGPRHPSTMTARNNLGSLYMSQNMYDEAEVLLRQVLVTRTDVLGLEDPDTAESLNNLAMLCSNKSEFGEAEALLKQALAIYEKVFEPDHPRTATTLNNLAVLYQKLHRYEDAKPLYEKALAIHEKILSPKHPNTLKLRENYEDLLHEMGRSWERQSAVPTI